MYERDIDPYEELTEDFCNFLEAHPWHCETPSSNLDGEYRANGWVHVPDDPDVEDGPYCPMDALDALEHCGRLAYQIAIGESVTPEEAARAAGRAVKCFTCYDYEQQPWFTEALPFTKKLALDDTRAADELKEPPADAGLGDKGKRESM